MQRYDNPRVEQNKREILFHHLASSDTINRPKVLHREEIALSALKKAQLICLFQKNALPLHSKIKGTLAEWLGNGLQNRVRRFESARYLQT